MAAANRMKTNKIEREKKGAEFNGFKDGLRTIWPVADQTPQPNTNGLGGGGAVPAEKGRNTVPTHARIVV